MIITIVNGQNHKGSTYRLGRMLAERLAPPEDIREVFLPRDLPEFCRGCASCILKDEALCPHHALLEPITRLLDGADLLIFTTPVYVYHATGSMKALLDHYGYRWMLHRPEPSMFRKPAVCLSTAAGGGMKPACRDIRDSLFFWGVPRIYCYGVAVAALSWDRVKPEKKAAVERKLAKMAKQIAARQGRVRPPLKAKLYFAVFRRLLLGGWNPADKAYWERMGWLGKARPWKPATKQEGART